MQFSLRTKAAPSILTLAALSLFPRGALSQEPDLSKGVSLGSSTKRERPEDRAVEISVRIGDRVRQELCRRESAIKGKLEVIDGQRRLFLGRYPIPFRIEDLAKSGDPDALEKFIAAKPVQPGGAKWLVRWEEKPERELRVSPSFFDETGDTKNAGERPHIESYFVIEHCPLGRLLTMREVDCRPALDAVKYFMRANEIAPTDRFAGVLFQRLLLEKLWSPSGQNFLGEYYLGNLKGLFSNGRDIDLDLVRMKEECPFLWLPLRERGGFLSPPPKNLTQDPFTTLHNSIVSAHEAHLKTALETPGLLGEHSQAGASLFSFPATSPERGGAAGPGPRIGSVEALHEYVRSVAPGVNDVTAEDLLSFLEVRTSEGGTPEERTEWKKRAVTFRSEYEALRLRQHGSSSKGEGRKDATWGAARYPWAEFSVSLPLVETVVGMVEHNLRRRG